MNTPFISLILNVKNGMPYVKEAIESVKHQAYKHFELVVQDAVSTDGTLDYLQDITNMTGIPIVSIESEPDTGSAEGFNKALKRCKGDIIGTIDTDNLLEVNSLVTVIECFKRHPNASAIYGKNRMITHDGETLHIFDPMEFDVKKVASCDLVPPFASTFFLKRNCQGQLYFNDRLAASDYDLWLRFGRMSVVKVNYSLAATRVHAGSQTCKAESYEQQCAEKIQFLTWYYENKELNQLTEEEYQHAIEGIYYWGLNSVVQLDHNHNMIDILCEKALLENIPSGKIIEFIRRQLPKKHYLLNKNDFQSLVEMCSVNVNSIVNKELGLAELPVVSEAWESRNLMFDKFLSKSKLLYRVNVTKIINEWACVSSSGLQRGKLFSNDSNGSVFWHSHNARDHIFSKFFHNKSLRQRQYYRITVAFPVIEPDVDSYLLLQDDKLNELFKIFFSDFNEVSQIVNNCVSFIFCIECDVAKMRITISNSSGRTTTIPNWIKLEKFCINEDIQPLTWIFSSARMLSQKLLQRPS